MESCHQIQPQKAVLPPPTTHILYEVSSLNLEFQSLSLGLRCKGKLGLDVSAFIVEGRKQIQGKCSVAHPEVTDARTGPGFSLSHSNCGAPETAAEEEDSTVTVGRLGLGIVWKLPRREKKSSFGQVFGR